MEEKDIRKYAGLMNELGLTGLEFGEGEGRIRLERMPAPMQPVPFAMNSAQGAEPVPVPKTETAGAAADTHSSDDSITSPMVGVFYVAAAENEEPFVKVGDRVKKGDTLCIIEAMKLMNEILAERDGIISEVCAVDGQAVDYGTVLFRIR